jgi:ribosomal protein L24p/L26e, archaeal/eukaryotic
MVRSSKPRKQRKYRYTAPLHVRKHFMHVHISKDVASKSGTKRRSAQVSRGDTVKIMSGSRKGKTGKVSKVDTIRGFIFIDGIARKNAKGRELQIPIRPSAVYITELNMTDKKRAAKLTTGG